MVSALRVTFLVFIFISWMYPFGLQFLGEIKLLAGEGKNFTDIGVSVFGDIYLIEGNYDELYLIDGRGRVIRKTGGTGWNSAALDSPNDLVVVDDLNILVADYNNHSVKRYDRKLNYIGEFSGDNFEDGFSFPLSVACDKEGFIYVLDGERREIFIFNSFLNQSFWIGGAEYGSFTIVFPVRMRVNADRNIYVLEEDGTVKIFRFPAEPYRIIPGHGGKAVDMALLGDAQVVILYETGYLDLPESENGRGVNLGDIGCDTRVVAFAVCGGKLYFLSPCGIVYIFEMIE